MNREGIRVGTAIGLFALLGRKRKKGARATVRWRDFWGEGKRAALLESLAQRESQYAVVKPSEENLWIWKPLGSAGGYRTWPRVVDLCEQEPISGLAEKRKGGLIDTDRSALRGRIAAYLDPERSWDDAAPDIGALAHDAADYSARSTRKALLAAGESIDDASLRRYAFLPFDVRWCYWTDARPLWNRARPKLAEQFWKGNLAFVCRAVARQPHEGQPAYVVTALPDHHLLDPNVVAIPFRLRTKLLGRATTTANPSARARAYLGSLGLRDPDDEEGGGVALWYHVVAMCCSPAWLDENGPAIRGDFPRVPLPGSRRLLQRSAALGRTVAALLDPDVAVDGVTSGKVRDDLRSLGAFRRADGKGQLDPAFGHLAVTARWGILQRGHVVMPSSGRVTEATAPELAGHPLGTEFLDVWLNGDVYLHAVPRAVWEFTVGGYQVVKKWLSYRQRSILGRDLALDEARHLTLMVRRIAALLLLAPELDEAFRGARDAASWPETVA